MRNLSLFSFCFLLALTLSFAVPDLILCLRSFPSLLEAFSFSQRPRLSILCLHLSQPKWVLNPITVHIPRACVPLASFPRVSYLLLLPVVSSETSELLSPLKLMTALNFFSELLLVIGA